MPARRALILPAVGERADPLTFQIGFRVDGKGRGALPAVRVVLEDGDGRRVEAGYLPMCDIAPTQLAAAAVARRFATARGEHYVVPRFAASRALRILQAKGSINQIARQEGVTRRYVEMVRSGRAEDPRQGSLFQKD